MESEKGVTLSIGPNAAYQGQDFIMERKFKAEHEEGLIKWVQLELPEDKKLDRDEERELECTSKEYLMWMRKDEIEACCPQLLSLKSTRTASASTEIPSTSEQDLQDDRPHPTGSSEKDETLVDMKEDVRSLISRAKKMMAREGSTPGVVGGKLLSNTINILNAYAKIGSLAESFQEYGALDLLLGLLSSKDVDVRKYSSDMLRSLANFDPSSRSYVLLQLTKSEEGSETSLQSRQMLLDLFADTASLNENNLLLRGMTFPQVPGRFVFSILKKYLKITSSSHNYTATTPSVPGFHPVTQNSEEDKFNIFNLWFQLLTELFDVFCWFQGVMDQESQKGTSRNLKGMSIFTGTLAKEEFSKDIKKKKKKNPYKKREDFNNDRDYGKYVKSVLKPEMKVRSRCNYESVSEGDFGIYKQTNDGTPPAQFEWEGMGGDTYWVYWHMVDLLPPSSDIEEEEEQATSFKTPGSQPYVIRSLALPGLAKENQNRAHSIVHRPFWWEVVSLVKLLPGNLTASVIELINQEEVKTFNDLINFKPTFSKVAEIVQYLESIYPHIAQEPLSIKDTSEFHEVYTDETTNIAPARDDKEEQAINESKFREYAPYTDPYYVEDTRAMYDVMHPADNYEKYAKIMRERGDELDAPAFHLKHLERNQDGSLDKVIETRSAIDEYIEKHPKSSKVGFHALESLRAAYELMDDELDLQECCMSGHFTLILKVMAADITSNVLQCSGLKAFFALMGSFGMDDSLPVPAAEKRDMLLSTQTKKVYMTTLASLSTAPEHTDLSILFKSMKTIVEYYHLEMMTSTKSNCCIGIRCGLWIIFFLLKIDEIREKMPSWEVPELIHLITEKFPDFATKKDLIAAVGNILPGYAPTTSLDDEEITPELIKCLNYEVMAVVKTLRRSEEICSKNPLPRLLRIMYKDHASTSFFHEPSKLMTHIFLLHKGAYYLSQALDFNRSSGFVENALVIFGSIIGVGEEEAAQLVLQGGLRAIIRCMALNPTVKTVQQMVLQMLTMLSKDADNLAVMSAENLITPLRECKERYLAFPSMLKTVKELTELCESREASRSSLHQNILGIIFSGTLQTILNAIEDSRREREMIHVPKFSAIIKYLSSGSGGSVSIVEKNQWWERVEVSSNPHAKDNLTDGDPTTSWESAGRSGNHWIHIFMKKGVVIRKLYLEVKSSDLTHMPQRVTIEGGASIKSTSDISTVSIPANFSGHFEVLSNPKKFYSVLVIRIKRCQQGGIDARIHSITCQAAQSSLWPIFGDLFLARSKLFYQIQVQTWLNNPDLGPLELFDKLSAVVLHEQTFADDFLGTALARQSIGQACRSAIITPLIDTLTEETAGPNLGVLIHEYIQVMKPPPSLWNTVIYPPGEDPASEGTNFSETLIVHGDKSSPEYKKAQDNLIQMSRIRRMCRLLVDCDDNTSSRKTVKEPEENKDDDEDEDDRGPQSPDVPPGTGTIAVARCWKEIVSSEVKQVLLQFDTKAPHVLCSKILDIYGKLKQAMLELFGGHSQFTLALKEGFSKGFQGLDEVRGVRVCEQICRFIDSMMDPVNKDIARFQNLAEHQRETLLLQLAEPLQFLHNLDLAHIFEHYYRRHLSTRILRGRSISLPLERRLAQAFAHCFPHKYPLQMMQDVEDSDMLLDRFCDNELLESLDQVMVHASTQADLSGGALNLAQKCFFYRQRCCQVYVLNPCFWPLRHRTLPTPSLPDPLSMFCKDYSSFFAASHEYGLRQHERPRKLHFTIYGCAALSYGNITFHTTTIQMAILLHFNQKNMMTLKSLHEESQLPYSALREALLCLTAEGQNILFSVTEEEEQVKKKSKLKRQQSAPTTSSDGTYGLTEHDEIVSLPPLRFRLGTKFTINEQFIQEIATDSFRFKDVHAVIGKSAPTKDLAYVFERRRAIIDAAIIRILKVEKEDSLDNIAVMVIQGCSAGRFERGPSFGRFDCSYRDVSSRVDRLVLDGYIRRDSANQQMLIYIPDKVPVSKEPVQESSSKTKPQGKRKRTSHALNVPEIDDAPLLGMLPSSRTLSVEQVEEQMTSVVDSLSKVLELSPDITEHLLCHSGWQKDKLIESFLNSKDGAIFHENGLAPEGVAKLPTSFKIRGGKGKSSCPICMHNKSNSEFISLWCGHYYCKPCWESHAQTKIDGHVLRLMCPAQGCHARPTRSFLIKLFGANSEAVKKFSAALTRNYVQTNGWLTWCCNPQGCGHILLKGIGMNTNMCQKCQWTSCFSCSFLEAHEPASCEHMRKWADAGGFYIGMDNDAKSSQLAQLIAKKCPSCSTQIEKNEGCMHMKCKCGHDFCWRCLKPWKPTHTDYFNCTAVVSQAARDYKKFVDYNRRCASHQKSKAFAGRLSLLVRGISESVPIKTLSFLSDACQLLVHCHKMLGYACVSDYFTTHNTTQYLGFLLENFESDTHALQAFLENALLSQQNLAHAIRTLPDRRIMDGYRLVSKIEDTREKLLIGYQHRFKLSQMPSLKQMESDLLEYDDSEDEEEEGTRVKSKTGKKARKEKEGVEDGGSSESGYTERFKPILEALWSWTPKRSGK